MVPASHVPHWMMPPHLVSVTAPQSAPSWAQVDGHDDWPSPKLMTPSELESRAGVDESPAGLPVSVVASAPGGTKTVPPEPPPPHPENTGA